MDPGVTAMESILVLLHTESDGSLGKLAFEVLGAARSLGAPFQVGLVGGEVKAAADSVAGCGATGIRAVAGAEFTQPRYASDAAAAEALARAAGATLILAPATSRWNRVIPGVAHRLGGRADTHVTGIVPAGGKLAVTRWYYRQRMEAVIERAQRPWFILLEGGCAEPAAAVPGSAAVEDVAVEAGCRTQVTGLQSPRSEQQTIRPDADLLFVAGAGWTKNQADGTPHVAEAEKLILGFLNAAQASLGSSKSLVDLSGEGQAVLGFLTHLNQIGQTGATPRHRKGLATCCHGEEPHVVGWRFVTERRAVNLDANCGWTRGKADVVYIADAFAVMAKVNEFLT